MHLPGAVQNGRRRANTALFSPYATHRGQEMRAGPVLFRSQRAKPRPHQNQATGRAAKDFPGLCLQRLPWRRSAYHRAKWPLPLLPCAVRRPPGAGPLGSTSKPKPGRGQVVATRSSRVVARVVIGWAYCYGLIGVKSRTSGFGKTCCILAGAIGGSPPLGSGPR